MMTGKLLTLIKKEFMAIWKDPRSRLVVTVMPFIQMILFVNAITMEVKNIDLLVIDSSRSRQSGELLNHFRASSLFRSVELADNRAAVREKMDNQEVGVIVEIPEDFAKNITNGKGTRVQIIVDGRQTNSAAVAGGYVTQIINDYSSSLIKARQPVVRHWFNPNLDYRQYSLVSLMALLSMVSALMLTSLSIAREREVGTFDQLIVSPLSSGEILAGKAIPGLLIAWAITCVMVILSILFFDFRVNGSLGLFLAADFVALTSLVGVGLFISSLCKTQQQAVLGVFTFQMPAVLLSGFISPIDNMPVILQHLTYLNPLRFFMVLAKGLLLKDMGWADVAANLVPLALISLLTLSIAGWSFKRRLE